METKLVMPALFVIELPMRPCMRTSGGRLRESGATLFVCLLMAASGTANAMGYSERCTTVLDK